MQSQLEPACKTHWTHVPKYLKIEILCHTAMPKRHVYWKPFSLVSAATVHQDLPNLLLFSLSVVSNSLWPLWIVVTQASLSLGFSGKSTEEGCHFLYQEIFLTRHQTHISCISCLDRRVLYQCATWGSPLPNLLSATVIHFPISHSNVYAWFCKINLVKLKVAS